MALSDKDLKILDKQYEAAANTDDIEIPYVAPRMAMGSCLTYSRGARICIWLCILLNLAMIVRMTTFKYVDVFAVSLNAESVKLEIVKD